MNKLFNRKGSSEMVSVILLVVVIGGLALAVTGTFTKQSKQSFSSGMTTQTNQLTSNFNEAIQNKSAETPGLSGSTN
ncbi:hypothetical protein [Alkaliphilus sp. B6464]|uniref:hypothetical protein n=1 Tax=Alkaliphilus sp. B6464 TaxID=2731219 RepID=UPI001BAD508C|nr:hypothetical protein [Alkaliphilus sp. B6464]QUH21984.1 hypothetical protein HYG84_18945 [Alkaliphilus sp. B6464]